MEPVPVSTESNICDLGAAEQSSVVLEDDNPGSPPPMVPVLLELVATLRSRIQRHCAEDAESQITSSDSQIKYLSLTGS